MEVLLLGHKRWLYESYKEGRTTKVIARKTEYKSLNDR